jgi:preprotein translocase SecE subunit
MWWDNAKLSLKKIMVEAGATADDVKAIGISYQMHGLVCVDKYQQVLRPSIIWCDSRAVPYGEKAFNELGSEQCLSHLLNSPGNFTASKLAWVKENEPEVFDKIDKIMLPGDYIAMKLSGVANTTISGLSEGMMWDFKEKKPAKPKDEKPGFFGRIKNWFHDVMTEMRRVVWPTPRELRNYSFAVIGLLIVFGVLVWAVDTGVVAGLGAFAGIRPVG